MQPGRARSFEMEADAKWIASGGKWRYICSQHKGKTEIPDQDYDAGADSHMKGVTPCSFELCF